MSTQVVLFSATYSQSLGRELTKAVEYRQPYDCSQQDLAKIIKRRMKDHCGVLNHSCAPALGSKISDLMVVQIP